MIKIIVIVVVVLIVALLLYATTKPNAFDVKRSIDIKASADKIFAFINDFHAWISWSPYEKLDPQMKKTYSGASNGKGAVYEWSGNSKAGAGRIEITDTSPPSKVVLTLDMIKPIAGHNIVEFTMTPAGESTHVTWTMHGRNAFIAKVMSVFLDMDKMIGTEFETGLATLKAAAEK